MIKTLPDTYIRQAVYSAINNIEVDGEEIPCFDSVVNTAGNRDIPDTYTVMTTQTNAVDKDNKCEYFWDSDILIEVFDGSLSTGNMVSRLFADKVLNEVRALTHNLVLPSESGLEILFNTQSFPNDLIIQTDNQNIIRKFIRLNLKIK